MTTPKWGSPGNNWNFGVCAWWEGFHKDNIPKFGLRGASGADRWECKDFSILCVPCSCLRTMKSMLLCMRQYIEHCSCAHLKFGNTTMTSWMKSHLCNRPLRSKIMTTVNIIHKCKVLNNISEMWTHWKWNVWGKCDGNDAHFDVFYRTGYHSLRGKWRWQAWKLEFGWLWTKL